MTSTTGTDLLSVDAGRLLDHLRRLAEIGKDPAGGITRPGFSPGASLANDFVAEIAHSRGLDARIDAGGNLLISHNAAPPARPALLLGSHLDTVVNGGWLDGAYGVLAAVEVLLTLTEHDTDLHTDVVVAAFANEEGALFPQPFWGSMVLAGMSCDLPAAPTDYHGNPLSAALQRAGGDLANLASAAWPPSVLAGYLELHIEQGPVLADEGAHIGVVDAIVGRTVLSIELLGVAAHAGTTPMRSRRDPLVAAADLTMFVHQLPDDGRTCQVATVGRIEVEPNSANTVPGRARLTVDLRATDPGRLDAADEAVRAYLHALDRRYGISHRCTLAVGSRPAVMSPNLRRAIRAAADDLGLRARDMNSGAGHDAQIMATVTPAAMIFVPSIGGVSHVPDENSHDQDLVAGAQVLLHTVHRLAAR
ncbi:N-carbamoyl-L-amino-acid hydrolase [Asanoa hainanensis]|uniref:N-carbamoyl-L-amino-acid hydrolase n=1 Tax=Asanoa hainanensis TaxID=560556 RepID=A0A239PFT0_9ACTN|nr:Zn-dependent hydrolase [Asanoa hainanensis]SNT65891.1 N-carbamoyl-L-amino-acid hydrolase [Asanoa hainanensis]